MGIQVSPVRFERRPSPTPPSAEAQELAAILESGLPDRDTLRRILATQRPDEIEVIRLAAEKALLKNF